MLDHLLLFDAPRASWRWDFTTGTLPAGSTFTRASAGWRFNSAGMIASVATDTPRYDYDPVTLAPHGLLSEMQSTNLLLRSQEFDNASWTKQAGSITADSVAAPDGTTTADKFTESSALAVHEVFQTVTAAADSYVGLSCFFKAGPRDKFFICLQSTSGNAAAAVFDLASGTVSETKLGATSGTIFSTTIRFVGNGWYRCGLVAKQANANPVVTFGMTTLATGNSFNGFAEPSYTGDGTSYGYFWGAQVDSVGVGITSYIPTSGSTVTRSADRLMMPIASLSGFNAGGGGVWVTTYRLHTVATGDSQNPLYVTDGAQNNIDIRAQSGTQGGPTIMGGLVRVGSYVINLNGGPRSNPFVRRRQAFGYGPSRGVIAHDGVFDVGSASAGGLPVGMTSIYLGGDGTTGQLNGSLESVAFYPGQRADSVVLRVSR